jgi:uncharacterized membrane protein
MSSGDEAEAIRKRRRISIIILLAGTVFIVGLFAYYGVVTYHARGYDGFIRFSKFTIPILVPLTVLTWVWELRSTRSGRR